MELTEQEVKIPAVLKNGSYVIMDAAETLGQFMVDGLPDKERFYNVIGTLIEKLAHNGKPIRAYGEMVALLWKTGNKEAVIQLEQLWNELAEKYKFSLFCAYPALHFIMDKDMAEDIRQCHNVNLPVFS